MSKPKASKRQRWARFRFSLVGELYASPPPKGELQQRLQALADKTYRHPTDEHRQLRLGFKTIERWYYNARDSPDPITALSRKRRSDAGKRVAVSPELRSVLEAQYRSHRRWTVKLHYDNLSALAEERSELNPIPSYKSVLRCMRENGWNRRREPARITPGQRRARERLEQREVRSFESAYVHGLWHLDFHQASIRILDESGTWCKVFALAIMDDHSRICCHLQFYLAETAECLIHGLSQAFMKRGLPRSLMTDNGSAMIAEETCQGLERLGVLHKTTLPYSPYQNGKQESFWGQLEGRLVEMLRDVPDLKLSFLNRAAQAWAEQDYQRNLHREIGTSPLQRMLAGQSVGRSAPDPAFMRLAFTRKITRKPRQSDATVVVDGIRYELPVRFSHLAKVTLRSVQWDKSKITLMDPDTDMPLAHLLPQDKVKNASGLRRVIQPSSAPSAKETEKKPLPALLRKWLADYAATGLPPAYLPKEELIHE